MKLTSKQNIKNQIRLKALFGRTIGTSLVLLLASCSATDSMMQEPELTGSQNDNLATVTLMIPEDQEDGDTWGTRAGYDTTKETALSNLYAVAVNSSTQEATVFTLMNGFNAGGGYRGYYITLERENTYKFYVFGNILRYMGDGSTVQYTLADYIKYQSDIDDLTLTFSRAQPLEPGHLPMACLHKELQITVDGQNQNNNTAGITVNATTKTIQIKADLKYLCSKVRYTILFNNERGEISEEYGKKNLAIRFNVDDDAYPVAFNIRKYTSVNDPTKVITQQERIKDSQSDSPFLLSPKDLGLSGDDVVNMDMSYWRLNLSRYEWPSCGENYPESPSDNHLEEWTGIDLNEWKVKTARAWQGVVYLPENNNGDKDVAYTGLDFPYVVDRWDGEKYDGGNFNRSLYKEIILFGDPNERDEHNHQSTSSSSSDYSDSSETGTNRSHGLVRGMMYDVVALVRTPDIIEIKVYAKTKPWEYNKVPETW